jgi:hypothetical protein
MQRENLNPADIPFWDARAADPVVFVDVEEPQPAATSATLATASAHESRGRTVLNRWRCNARIRTSLEAVAMDTKVVARR